MTRILDAVAPRATVRDLRDHGFTACLQGLCLADVAIRYAFGVFLFAGVALCHVYRVFLFADVASCHVRRVMDS